MVLAFDVGGSHIAAAQVAGDAVGPRVTLEVDPDGGAEEILDRWRQAGRAVLGGAAPLEAAPAGGSPRGVAVAFPRPFDYAAGICRTRHKFAALYGRDLRRELAVAWALPTGRVRFLNDADAFLIGALHGEALAGEPRAMGITLGTGLGSAFWADGAIVEGGPGVPPEGEIYCLPWRGATLEDALSTRAIVRAYTAAGGEALPVHLIAARAEAGEGRAGAVWEGFGRELAAGLRPLLAAFRPRTVLLGGNISRAAPLFLPAAAEGLAGLEARLRPVAALDTAALAGAARACFGLTSE
ncbi:MAG: ROK family protein [Terriglobales bacterium]